MFSVTYDQAQIQYSDQLHRFHSSVDIANMIPWSLAIRQTRHFGRVSGWSHATKSLTCSNSGNQRSLHLAPPFLLDNDYVPHYQMISSRDAAKKRSLAYAHLRNCNLCPRMCGVNRYETTGMCLIGEKAKVNVIAPHFGEGKFLFSPLSFSHVFVKMIAYHINLLALNRLFFPTLTM